MKIKLVKPWQLFEIGHVFEPQANLAGELVRLGTAVEVPDITATEPIETASTEPPQNAKRPRGRPRKVQVPV